MKRTFAFIGILSFILAACGTESGIEITRAWARPAAQGENGAIYFVIHNRGREADELTGVSSDIAEAVEMHESKMEGEVMQMHQLASVPLPGDTEIPFAPGGLHIMLIGLRQQLEAGDEIDVTLHFKNFGDIHLRVPVQEAAASAGDH